MVLRIRVAIETIIPKTAAAFCVVSPNAISGHMDNLSAQATADTLGSAFKRIFRHNRETVVGLSYQAYFSHCLHLVT
jgi:hypothetical protein